MADTFPFFMATDSIAIDKRAPWMEKAREAMQKGTREFKADDSFAKLFYVSLVQDEVRGRGRHPLLKPVLEQAVKEELAAEKAAVASRNAAIGTFLATVKTDPAFDKKHGRSSSLPLITHGDPEALAARGRKGSGQAANWQVTAWCAAFVNWCLMEAGSPRLGYATASSWLNFGTPLATPVYGCITVMPPMDSTGGGTGHVGFFVEQRGKWTRLLGGNQHDEINIMGFGQKPVGYRWPTAFNYLRTEASRLA